MQYMLAIYIDPTGAPAPDTAEAAETHQAWMTYTEWVGEQSTVIAGAALQPTDTATTVRVNGGEPLYTDGPFAETKEILAGIYVIDVPDLDAALAVAAKAPNVTYGSVEVRPVWDVSAAAA